MVFTSPKSSKQLSNEKEMRHDRSPLTCFSLQLNIKLITTKWKYNSAYQTQLISDEIFIVLCNVFKSDSLVMERCSQVFGVSAESLLKEHEFVLLHSNQK